MSETFWGIDLGGTKLEGTILSSLHETQPIARRRIPTEAAQGYEHILQRIKLLVTGLREETGLAPSVVGVGHPGMLDPVTNCLKNSNTQCLNGRPLKLDLERELGVEVRCANDANCFALAEALLGAGRGAETVFGVIMGTGVGGGVVVRGSVLGGAQGLGGEWGHNVLIPWGPPCYCGKNGCVETILSGPALESYYATQSGNHLTLEAIRGAASQGDAHAQATLERLYFWFGRAIGVVVNILDPHVVVLGGGVSNVPELYTRGLEQLGKTIFNDQMHTRIVRNELGDSAGVFGAAMLCRSVPAEGRP